MLPFASKILNGLFLALVIAGSMGYSLAAGLAHWPVWGGAYALIPFILIGFLYLYEANRPLIGVTHHNNQLSQKESMVDSILVCLIIAGTVLLWPVFALMMIILSVYDALDNRPERKIQ